MEASKLSQALEAAAADPDYFMGKAYNIVEGLTGETNKLEIIEVMLRFIETHPGVDYGAPGPLAGYMEEMHNLGYEEKLLESLSRQPTSETIGMMHRVVNGTRDPGAKQKYLQAIVDAKHHPAVGKNTLVRINQYLEYHGVG